VYPLSNLGTKLRIDMRTEIWRLHPRLGTTIVYVTHDQIEAMTLATTIAGLRDGVLQQFGTPADVYNDPANMFVADFMGSPSMNLIPARVEGNGKSLSIVLARDGQGEGVRLPAGGNEALASHSGRELIFGIRPEAVTDPEGADRTAGALADATCNIEVIEPAGSDTFALTRLGGREVTARLRADAAIQSGTEATLTFNMAKAVYFDSETEMRVA